ncbi:MAG TPA: CoA-binding protein [Firmicutes bacterium]|nr:CoA-binding protein [Bacillota bacterium]
MADLKSLFRPDAVAVVGASKSPGKVGHSILMNIIKSGYKGKIYPINPKESEIEGLKCYPSVSEIKADLAVIVIPAGGVLQVAEECGRQGIRNLIVITAGFKEVGREGAELESRLVEICKKYSINLVGPNCLGIMDTHSPLDASFAPKFALPGEIAFISQSGALGAAILDWSVGRGLGFSKFISLGNKAGLDEADFIESLADDPDTKVILCYLESINRGQRFMDVAREASKKKPVIVYKSGVSAAGARAASSHTGSLAGNDRSYEAAFKQCGVLRVKKLEDLFSLATAFTTEPLPAGNTVAVVTNAGGAGIITTDNIEASGLKMAQPSESTVEELKKGLPPAANFHNPFDVLGDARADRYEYALERVLADPNVNNVIVLLTPQAVTESDATAEAIIRCWKKDPRKPLVTSFIGGQAVEGARRKFEEAGIPTYNFPEAAVGVIDGLARYAAWRERAEKARAEEMVLDPEPDREKVKKIIAAVRADGRNTLLGSEAAEVAEAYKIPAAPSVLARTSEEAVAAARDMGFPVVMKLAAPKVTHKTDLGGVALNIKTEEGVKETFERILRNLKEKLPDAVAYGVEVQKMMPPGRELIIGMSRDPQFGPMIMFGMGGIYVNLLQDVSFRMAYRLTKSEIEDMLQETKAYKLLKGYRGEAPADIPALVDAVARIAALTIDFPDIAELDINPVFAYEKGLSALDVKIILTKE